jgi:hypothetical protein
MKALNSSYLISASLLLLVCLISTEIQAQTIGRKKARMELLSYNPLKDDGEMVLEMDVRMADCVSHLELSSANSKRPLVVAVSEEDYYLSEDGEEQIYLKVSLGNMKEILRKKKEVPAGLTIYSKSGKPIYSRQLTLIKEELIASLSRN